MKKLIIVLTILLTLNACKSELELKPESILTYNGYWDTEEAVRAAHAGLYASFRGYHSTIWTMGEVRSDIWGGATFESPSNLGLIQQNISTTNVPFSNWAGFYGLLHRINDFLENAPNVTFINPSDQDHLLGQIYGMRAYIYYTMLRTWGDVPITTETIKTTDVTKLNKPRSPKTEVMALIKDDIERSLSAFGTSGNLWQNKKVYWSKAATLILKGDVYLWSGKLLGGGNADYVIAKNALEQVSGLGFSLTNDFNDLWGQNNENNNEFIFTIDYQQDQAGNFYNGSFTGRATEINATYDDRGNSMEDFTANGGSRYGPTEKILQLLDDVDDSRRDATFIRLYDNSNGHIPFDTDGYQAAILKKFLGIIDGGVRLSNNNVPIYRFADVLLLLAEAKNNLGENPENEINSIRQRAYGINYNALTHGFVSTTQQANAKEILDESLKEFIGEGKRWWDLRRASGNFIFDEIQYLEANDAYKLQLPITNSMLANDPNLEQTEGYEN